MVRPLRAFSLVAVGCVGAIAACSSFGGDAPTPAVDAGGDAAADASSDSEVVDGAADGEGGWVPCTARAPDPRHFCDDFDDLTLPLGTKWSGRESNDGGVLDATDDAVTPPRAFLVGLPTYPTGPAIDAIFIHDVDKAIDVGQAQQIRADFDLRWDLPPVIPSSSKGFVTFLRIQFDSSACYTNLGDKTRAVDVSVTTQNRIEITTRGMNLECAEATDAAAANDFGFVIANGTTELFTAFRHVSVVIARSPCPGQANGASATLTIPGPPAVCIPLGLDPFTHAKNLKLIVGLTGGGLGNPTRATVDDVTFDVE